MLLNSDVTHQASYMMYQSMQAGFNIQPKEGTILEVLVNSYLQNPRGCQVDAIKNGENCQVNHEFDEQTSAFIDQVTKGIRAEMDIANNIVKPIIATMVETYNDITVTENMEMFTPNVVLHRLPVVYLNNTFTGLIEEQSDRFDSSTILPGADSRVKFSDTVPLDYLRGAFKTGIDSLDERLLTISEKYSNQDLLGVYSRAFLDKYMRLATMSIDDAVVTYFITLHLQQGLPDGCNGGRESFANVLTSFRNRMASYLMGRQREYNRLVKDGTLVIEYEVKGQEHTITVVPEVYLDKYLRGGGTPETLLGSMLNGIGTNRPVTLLLEPMTLRAADNKYNLVREVALRDIEKYKAELALGNVKRALSLTLDNIYETNDGDVLTIAGDRAGCVKRAIEFTANTSFTTSTNLSYYVFDLIGATLEHGAFYVNVLRQLNQSLSNNNKLTPEQATALYVEYRITDWSSLLSERVD